MSRIVEPQTWKFMEFARRFPSGEMETGDHRTYGSPV